MAQNIALSKLSTSLKQFNEALDNSSKLDENALQVIQQYLNDPEITTLDSEDKQYMQRPLEQLEHLRDEVTIRRVPPTLIKQIDQQLINLADYIKKNPAETKQDAFFIIVKLEVCFLNILSEEAMNSSKHWQIKYENKMAENTTSESSHVISHSHALYADRQQRFISELMNAVLFDIIEYFRDKDGSFIEHVTQKLLDSLNEIDKHPEHPSNNEITNEVFHILSNTARIVNLSMSDLIHHLEYAIIGFGERMNEFTDSLQTYTRTTKSPTLSEFNETTGYSPTLSFKEVNQLNDLFQLYCKLLLSPARDISQSSFSAPIPSILFIIKKPIEEFTKQMMTVQITDDAPLHISYRVSSIASLRDKMILSQLMSATERETDLKFIWAEPNVKDYYGNYCTTIHPASSTSYNTSDLLSQIPDDWINSRIFLCVSAQHARQLLSHIHHKAELYHVYVLCQDKSEEIQFQKETDRFNKVRTVTNNQNAFLRRLALDIIPTFIKIGNFNYSLNNYPNAITWYKSAVNKINEYEDPRKKSLLAMVNEKIANCSR
ncbi:unnamed protein product [Adineta steineri]|uniref:Uncharacterized protein n=1 Tax=Adineta steineri TaxID=433720 RepID=A0A819IDA1_9BILA|nr:unnamed protein product [Adineta steineri]